VVKWPDRQFAARFLVVLASVVLVLAVIAGYVRHAAIDSDQFANRATAALRDESVRKLIAERVTDGVIRRQENLIAARPIIESVTSAVVGGRAFTSLFRAGVRDVHRAVFRRDENTVTLTLRDVGTVVAAALERLRPSLARQIENATGRVQLIKRDVGTVAAKLARLGKDVGILLWLLTGVLLALVAGAIALSRDRRRTVVELGIGAAAAGVLVAVALAVGRSVAVHHVQGPDAQAAAGAVWDAFLRDLRTAAWIVAGSGAVVAAAAASLIRPVELGRPLRRAWEAVWTEPARPALRVVRGVGLVAAGILVIVAHDALVAFALTAIGVYLIYEGVTAILRLVYRPPAPGEERPRPHSDRRLVAHRRELATALVAAAVVVGVAALFLGTGGTTTAAPARGPCEGNDSLCDRPLDQVALPATHNAMSVPLPGWFSAEQDAPIAAQLRDGVRGLLIDSHYADRLPNGRLRTDFGSRTDLSKLAKQDGLSQDALDSALRIRERLGFRGSGKRGMYLCHTLCEIGGTSLGPVLHDIRDFLVANPGQVLVVINQDYVTPADFVGAVKDAGLEQLVYRGPVAAGKWPTLREMIDTNQRVVFLAENHAGAAPWYHLAYQGITQETPYKFPKVARLTQAADLPASCQPNRGTADAPLFLVNHWISTDPVPLPSDAAKVNAFDPLLARMEECRRLRHHLPNLVAVNFYRRGDLFRVVDRLNGIR
jgi:hypothetical protein